jgi:hypothetical protein
MSIPKLAIKNRNEVESSKVCGCYHCIKIFNVENITEWTDQNKTALCPFCNVDSIICDRSFAITENLLIQARNYWF